MNLATKRTRRFGAFLERRCARVAIGMGLLEIGFATVPPIVRGADRRGAATLLPRLRVTPPQADWGGHWEIDALETHGRMLGRVLVVRPAGSEFVSEFETKRDQ